MNSGFIPVKVSLNALANVTAGLAKEVEEVNQYPAEIYNPTAGATASVFNFLTPRMVMRRPKVAMNSLKYIFIPLLSFVEICRGSKPNIILASIAPKNPPATWKVIKQKNCLSVNSFFKNMIKLTAGLK